MKKADSGFEPACFLKTNKNIITRGYNMIDKIKYWIKHNEIQAFGLALSVITLCLVLTISNIAVSAAGQDQDYLNGNAMYVSNFTTSLSGI